MRRHTMAALFGAGAVGCLAYAVQAGAQAVAPVEVLGSPAAYRPVTSDLMNSYVQPRHTKLFMAGTQGDWVYADYERHNIGGAFGRIVEAIPVYKGASNAALVAAFVTPQLAALDTAIKARDAAAFAVAYDGLTAGCNGCHRATGHGFVVIRRPGGGGPFPDQPFSVAAP